VPPAFSFANRVVVSDMLKSSSNASPSVVYPLPDHPEFSIIKFPGFHEYRLEHQNVLAGSRVTNTALNSFSLVGFIAICLHVVSPTSSANTLILINYLAIRRNSLSGSASIIYTMDQVYILPSVIW